MEHLSRNMMMAMCMEMFMCMRQRAQLVQLLSK